MKKIGFAQHRFSWKKNGSGFTLMELLIVIAIIGLLASATIVLLEGARIKSRDARRLSDLGEIRNGLNLYFAETAGFPVYPSGVDITGLDAFSLELESGGHMIAVPADPATPLYNYNYTSNIGGTDFVLSFCLEGSSIPNYSQGCGNEMTP